MFFWNSLASSMMQSMLAIWSLVPLHFLNPAYTSGNSKFMCWRRILKDFEHCLASMWNVCNHAVVWTLFGIALLSVWNGNWLFQSWCTPRLRERSSEPHNRLSLTCLLVFKGLLWRHGSAGGMVPRTGALTATVLEGVACDISPHGGGCY